MNKLVKRGIKAYNIFLKNKMAASLMMFIPGVMMTIAAIQGNGNDTKTLPLMILIAGEVFTLNYIPVRQQEITPERTSMRRAMAASGGVVKLLRYNDPTGKDAYTRTTTSSGFEDAFTFDHIIRLRIFYVLMETEAGMRRDHNVCEHGAVAH